MPIETGSLVARGTFGMEPQETRSDEDLREDLRRLRGEILEVVREMIAEAERRRKGRRGMGMLRITKCNVPPSGMIDAETGTYFETSMNPANLKTDLSICYSGAGAGDKVPVGAAGASPKYKATNAENLNFEMVLDGTGGVPGTGDLTVADQITKLKSITHRYDGSKHEPNVVQITWGDGSFEAFTGRLVSLGINYTLFRPSGEALRAKVMLGLRSFNSVEEVSRSANKTSPDLTHIVLLRAGNTLPLLCARIYKDPSRYLAAARHNRLDSFRTIKPGTELHFPPMR